MSKSLIEEGLVWLMAQGSYSIILAGSPALSVNASCLQSELADFLLHTHPKGDVAVIWFFDGITDRYRVSLRSRPDGPDVSAIAKQFGGGGHRNAAGFECTELPWRRADGEED